MNVNDLAKYLLAGIVLGNGPCLLHCLPIISPLIFNATFGDRNLFNGLKLAALFSFSRMFAYSMLGLLSVVFFRMVSIVAYRYIIHLRVLLAVLVLALGVSILFSRGHGGFCRFMDEHVSKKSERNLLLLGLLIGVSTCPPLMGVLTYIAAMSDGPIDGLFAGFAFGLGTTISVVIPAGFLLGLISKKLKTSHIASIAVRLLSGGILVYLSLRIFLSLALQ